MISYDSTARVPFAKGGKVDKKPIKPKRIILWKGKAKDWPGAQKAKERTGKADGGRIGLKQGGPYLPLRGASGSKGAAKSFRGKEGFKESQAMQKALKKTKRPVEDRDKISSKRTIAILKDHGHKAKVSRKGDKIKVAYSQGAQGKFKTKVDTLPKNPTLGKVKDWLGYKEGGKVKKNWIQGVNKSIKARGTKGVCTGKKFGSASCKPGSKRYNLAKTFKKMARAKHASGGLVRFI